MNVCDSWLNTKQPPAHTPNPVKFTREIMSITVTLCVYELMPKTRLQLQLITGKTTNENFFGNNTFEQNVNKIL